MCNKEAKKNFGIIEFMLIVIIALLGWILVWLNETDKLYVAVDQRLQHLEYQDQKGDRNTAADGAVRDIQIDTLLNIAIDNKAIHREIEIKLDELSGQISALKVYSSDTR